MTKSPVERAITSGDAALRALPFVPALGLAALIVAIIVGFEEPDPTLLAISAAALLVPVVGAFVHLAWTRELNPQEKRIWFRELTGRQAVGAWSHYLSCSDRREELKKLARQ